MDVLARLSAPRTRIAHRLLTYHRWASAEQAPACHPRLPEFIAEKRRFDPNGVFTSDWFTHHERLLGSAS